MFVSPGGTVPRAGTGRRGAEESMHERTPAANTHTLTHTQPYIPNSVQSSSLASLQHFSSVSSNPPSLTAPAVSHCLPPLSPHNPSACRGGGTEREREIGAALLFRWSLCNRAISCRRPGAAEKVGGGGWTSPKKQQEAASHLSPLLRNCIEKLQGGG